MALFGRQILDTHAFMVLTRLVTLLRQLVSKSRLRLSGLTRARTTDKLALALG